MAFKITPWGLSNEVEEITVPIEAGEHDLYITSASYDDSEPANPVYKIGLKSLQTNAEFTQAYWLNSTDKDTGAITKNKQARGTLITLGKALFGVEVGIPHPNDIIDGVVHAEVKMSKPNDKGKSYARIYQYEPVPQEIAMIAGIEQYYIGMENEIPQDEE